MNRPATSVAARFAALQTSPPNSQTEKDFLTLATTLAAQSTHPWRDEIQRVARMNQCPHRPVTVSRDFPGQGFGGAARLPGEGSVRTALFGTREFLKESGLELPSALEVVADRWQAEGALLLFGGWEGSIRGIMRFGADEPR